MSRKSMKEPNREPALSPSAIHTMEHLAATFLRIEPKMSPVAHEECTRTSTGSSSENVPLIKATCSRPLLF